MGSLINSQLSDTGKLYSSSTGMYVHVVALPMISGVWSMVCLLRTAVE